MQEKFQPMHEHDIKQNDDDEICLVGKTMDLCNERSHLFLELLSHLCPMTLEHDVAITANANRLPNKVL
jgi:hypothetical protein